MLTLGIDRYLSFFATMRPGVFPLEDNAKAQGRKESNEDLQHQWGSQGSDFQAYRPITSKLLSEPVAIMTVSLCKPPKVD